MEQPALVSRRFTPEEYALVSERVQIKVEYLNGQIVPKESLSPLPEWVIDELLKPHFNLSILNYEFPMTSKKHKLILRQLARLLDRKLDDANFRVFSQDPEIYISLSGSYRIPDVTVAPGKEDCVWKENMLTNPLVVIEVLSPSNKGDDFMDKLRDYKSLQSLKEYWLVSQDRCHIERYVRKTEKVWESLSYDHNDKEIEFPSLGVSLKIEDVYEDVEFPADK